jgi:hypothetical protein
MDDSVPQILPPRYRIICSHYPYCDMFAERTDDIMALQKYIRPRSSCRLLEFDAETLHNSCFLRVFFPFIPMKRRLHQQHALNHFS